MIVFFFFYDQYREDGNVGDYITYDSFQDRFKQLCKDIIERTDRPGPFGSHTIRKTAYLWACWGGGEEIEMMHSARHKTPSQAIKYIKDSKMQKYMAELNRKTINGAVSKWKPIVIEVGCIYLWLIGLILA